MSSKFCFDRWLHLRSGLASVAGAISLWIPSRGGARRLFLKIMLVGALFWQACCLGPGTKRKGELYYKVLADLFSRSFTASAR